MDNDPLIARVVVDYRCSKCGGHPGGFGWSGFELRMNGKVYDEKAICAAIRAVEAGRGAMKALVIEVTRRLYLEQAFLNIQRELTTVVENSNES